MKNRALKLIGFAGALALLPAMAGAQEASKLSFGVMGGLSLPMGDFGDGVESGYNITGSIYAPLGEKLKLRGDVGYESFGFKVGDNSFNVLSFTGNVILPLGTAASEGGIRPYVIGGAGAFRGSCDGCDSETDLGINVGGGFEFRLSGFTTFAEARFVNVFSEGDSTNWIPITFGIRF